MKKSNSRKVKFDVHLPHLLDEVLSNPSAAILKIPIVVTKGILAAKNGGDDGHQ